MGCFSRSVACYPGASELSVTFGQAPGEATITASGVDQGQVGALMFSDDLANWFPVAATTETSLGFSERSAASQRFFQLLESNAAHAQRGSQLENQAQPAERQVSRRVQGV